MGHHHVRLSRDHQCSCCPLAEIILFLLFLGAGKPRTEIRKFFTSVHIRALIHVLCLKKYSKSVVIQLEMHGKAQHIAHSVGPY